MAESYSNNLISVERLAKFRDLMKAYVDLCDKGVSDELKGIIGTPIEGKTLVQMITEAQSEATYDDTEIRGLISDLFDLVGVLPEDATEEDVVNYLKNLIDGIEGRLQTVEEKVETVEEGAQVNIIESVKLNGTALTITDKEVDVVIPNETVPLSIVKIIDDNEEEAEDAYHGSEDKEVTSDYLYKQMKTIVPNIISKVNGIFNIASNIQYRTVNTKAELLAVDTTELDKNPGAYIYLVKQDESVDPRVPADEENGTPAEYYTTMYIYVTTEKAWDMIGTLNVSEQMLQNSIATAIKAALTTTITDPESGELVEIQKFYTRTEGNAVAKAVSDEVTRATTAEEGLEGRIAILEGAVGGEGSVTEAIETAKSEAIASSKTETENQIKALNATVTNEIEGESKPDITVTVTEAQGKLTSVSATVNASYEVSGTAQALIEALDSTVSTVTELTPNPVVAISVTETDGKLTGITASIKENTFATYAQGALADTALQASDIATAEEIEALFADITE